MNLSLLLFFSLCIFKWKETHRAGFYLIQRSSKASKQLQPHLSAYITLGCQHNLMYCQSKKTFIRSSFTKLCTNPNHRCRLSLNLSLCKITSRWFTSNKIKYKNKDLIIFGGGDSALDWAVELSKDSQINLVHRRDDFRGAQSTVDKVHGLVKDGKINLYTKYQMNSIKGDDQLESIDIKNDDKETKTLKTDYALGFFGLIMQLGPIANWGLNINKKTIEVDTEKFETNQKGIYAVGDICSYPGKLKLILSGFHEGALAARACFKLARPNEKYRFEFTTTSSNLLKRLGKKE